MATANPTGASGAPPAPDVQGAAPTLAFSDPFEVGESLSVAALKEAQYALLSNLKGLLDSAHDAVWRMQDEGLDTYPLCIDSRSLFDWITSTVEALDALGWRDLIEQDKALDAKRKEETSETPR